MSFFTLNFDQLNAPLLNKVLIFEQQCMHNIQSLFYNFFHTFIFLTASSSHCLFLLQDVSCNELQSLPVELGQLECLRDLNLRRNQLTTLPEGQYQS